MIAHDHRRHLTVIDEAAETTAGIGTEKTAVIIVLIVMTDIGETVMIVLGVVAGIEMTVGRVGEIGTTVEIVHDTPI